MKTALAIAPAALILLAGCASPDPAASGTPSGGTASASTADGTAPGPTTATTSTAATTTSAAPSTSTTTAAAASTALPTAFIDVNKTIDDGDLKQSITVKRIARQLPWPAGYKASAQAYELVAVEMTWTPSGAYTIPIRRQDFDVSTRSQIKGTPDPVVDETLKAAGWSLLPDQVAAGGPVSGWVVFKVDPRAAPTLVLDYVRPAAQVTGEATSFPAKTFTAPLTS